MESAAREFLFRLLKTPSPSGYEQPIQRLVRDYLSGVADTVTTDSHGNVIGANNSSCSLFTAVTVTSRLCTSNPT